MRLSFLAVFLFLCASSLLQANNIQVSNIELEEDILLDTYSISFDISWENSWRTSSYESNNDAAWVFMKWRSDGFPEWSHMSGVFLETPGSEPSGAEMIFPDDGTGFFIQRSTDGIGDILFEDITVQWDDGIKEGFEICVYAIEMVYIPEGSFYAGDGSGDFATFESGNTGAPFLISSENQLTLGGTSAEHLANNWDGSGEACFGIEYADNFSYSTTATLPTTYPKGFQAYYIMKYEISQGQYAAFLNTLGQLEAADRFNLSYGVIGQSIKLIGTPSRYRADEPDRAAIGLQWFDFLSYASWSGLRPMSELEFEKACRGPLYPKVREYAWGNAELYVEPLELSSDVDGNEIIVNAADDIGNANFLDAALGRPVRGGLFASLDSSPDRQECGASYYGVMELSGNVSEHVIGLGTPAARLLDGSEHGTGTSDVPDDTSWILIGGTRGGGFSFPGGFGNVSYRCLSNEGTIFGSELNGGRLVRSSF